MNDYIKWIQTQRWLAGLDLEVERIQAEQEGRDLTTVTGEFDRLCAVANDKRDEQWYAAAGALLDRVQ